MPLVRRVSPELFANTLVGVVPNSTSAQNNAELEKLFNLRNIMVSRISGM